MNMHACWVTLLDNTYVYRERKRLIFLLSNYYNSKHRTRLVNIKKLLISKRRIGILKKLPKQGEDSESL